MLGNLSTLGTNITFTGCENTNEEREARGWAANFRRSLVRVPFFNHDVCSRRATDFSRPACLTAPLVRATGDASSPGIMGSRAKFGCASHDIL